MVKYLKAKLLILLCIAGVSFSYGQSGTISGVITDRSNGETLPGANVIIEGTTTGTTADINGRFSLDVPAGEVKLLASFLGFEPQKTTVKVNPGQKLTVNFALYADVALLDEFVVIGYGVQKKTDRTGAVTNVKSDELIRGTLSDPIQALQGKAAGITITKKGGDPNSGFDVRIRGASSLSTSTAPLYVIDGVIGADPTMVASEDIESYNVLKDASSAAIYGSRGANGVIIITTKRGKDSKGSHISVSSNIAADAVANRFDLLSASELRQFVADNNMSNFIDGGADTDWQDQIYRTGISQTHTVTFSGASEKSGHYASVSYNNMDGVILGTSKERTTALINFDQKALNDKLVISSGLSGAFEKNDYISYSGNGPTDILYHMIQRNPTDPVYNEDGTFYDVQREFNYWNPVALIDQIQNERDAKKFYGYLKADLDIYKGFSAGINLAYNRDDSENFYFEPNGILLGTRTGNGNRKYDNKDSRLLETTLRYVRDFNKVNVNFVGGYSFQEEIFTGFSAKGENPFLNYAGANNLGLLQNLISGESVTSYKSSNRMISFFGRGVASYDSKYFLTATIRRDGSSKFGDNNEWGWFPSASFKWQISNEEFMQNLDFISNLGLRLGFGITGNQEIGSYRDIEYYINSGNSINFETGEQSVLFEYAHSANPDLKWEENREINIGIDYGFLNDKITGSIDLFQKNTYDLLGEYSVPVPPYPVGRIWANVGEIEVKGLDFNIMYYPVRNRDFEWKTSLVFSTYKQKVVSLSNDKFDWSELHEGYLSGRGLVGDINWTQIVAPGYSIGTWFMPEFYGIMPLDFSNPKYRGLFIFYTEGDGQTTEPQNAERRVVGKATPDFELGWSNYFTFFKNFDLSMSFRSLYGYKVFNTTKLIFGNPNWLPNLNVLQVAVEEYENGLRDSPKLSSYYLEDASFLRLDDITVGYNIRKKLGFDNIKVSVSAKNLFVLTNYSGTDPEISTSGLSFGLDQYNVYPKTRTISMGLSLSL